jgi:shikimate kinase
MGMPGGAMRGTSRIALLGLRGAGKSTLGRRLADDLDVPFVELTVEIERVAGCGLGEIHNLLGPAAYRRYERRALEETIQLYPDAVIATPGGLVSDPATLNLLLGHCYAIWLRASPEEHMSRVLAQGDLRPMAGNDRGDGRPPAHPRGARRLLRPGGPRVRHRGPFARRGFRRAACLHCAPRSGAESVVDGACSKVPFFVDAGRERTIIRRSANPHDVACSGRCRPRGES